MSLEMSPEFPGKPGFCLPSHLRKPRLNRSEASEYLLLAHGITRSPSTLAKDAWRGDGPRYNKVNRSPLYPREALDTWASGKLGERRQSPSGDAARG